MQLTTARYQQQLLEHAAFWGAFFPAVIANHGWRFLKMSWSVAVLEVCAAANPAAVHSLENATGTLCGSGCTQEEAPSPGS